MEIVIRKAVEQDSDRIACMLTEAGTPAADLDQWIESCLLAEVATNQGTEIVATAGLQKYGSFGLLRSFVMRSGAWTVESSLDMLGLILSHARDSGLEKVYLLTQSPSLFIHMGFTEITRDNIPEQLLNSSHFIQNLEKAAPMQKVLCE